MKYIVPIFLTVTVFIMMFSCNGKQENDKSKEAVGPDGWLKGSDTEKFKTIAGQLRGFDATMVEVGYRYQELYWAGQDENWDYASYQVEKIETTLKNGFEPRPKREKSGIHFLHYVLPELKKTIESRDTTSFNKGFVMLTSNCNSCHIMEKVPFLTVKVPTERQSPIRK